MNIPFTKPYFSEESVDRIGDATKEILRSGRLMLGKYTTKFENEFASYHDTEFAVSTNSCTTALQICLMHYDVKGCDVLVPSASFITDISVINWAGGNPVLVDCDLETLSFDLDDLARKLTPNTKGIIWVHLTGLISRDYKKIKKFADDNNLFLIEDCAHAHGASIDGLKAGTIGDAGCFSFYPTKVMTTGTGGMITTNNPDLKKSALELRMFGRENGTGSVTRSDGNDWFMDELRACVGFEQVVELDRMLASRRQIATTYQTALEGTPGLRLLEDDEAQSNSWYHYTVFVDGKLNHNKVIRLMSEKYSIPTKAIYIPMHQEEIFRSLDDGTLKNTEVALNQSLCLPLYVGMSANEINYVVSSLKSVLSEVEGG